MNGLGIGREIGREHSRDGMELHDFLVGRDGTGNDRGRRWDKKSLVPPLLIPVALSARTYFILWPQVVSRAGSNPDAGSFVFDHTLHVFPSIICFDFYNVEPHARSVFGVADTGSALTPPAFAGSPPKRYAGTGVAWFGSA